jgi:hypothetical protein
MRYDGVSTGSRPGKKSVAKSTHRDRRIRLDPQHQRRERKGAFEIGVRGVFRRRPKNRRADSSRQPRGPKPTRLSRTPKSSRARTLICSNFAFEDRSLAARDPAVPAPARRPSAFGSIASTAFAFVNPNVILPPEFSGLNIVHRGRSRGRELIRLRRHRQFFIRPDQRFGACFKRPADLPVKTRFAAFDDRQAAALRVFDARRKFQVIRATRRLCLQILQRRPQQMRTHPHICRSRVAGFDAQHPIFRAAGRAPN